MKQTINFSKMHGLGNDFIIIDAISQSVPLTLPVTQLSNRHVGVGCDQLILILPSSKADFACRIFNSDGSEAEQCGNGMRCVARFVHENKLIDRKNFSLETLGGVISVTINNEDYQSIAINMGIPQLEHKTITLPPHSGEFSILSVGNPHAILTVPSVQLFPVTEIGAMVGTHSFFPKGTNVGFMEIINRQHIRLRTFERGAGETFACGSNASAAAVAGIWNNWLDHKVQVELTLGSLWIEWDGIDKPVTMMGPASDVFKGTFVSSL